LGEPLSIKNSLETTVETAAISPVLGLFFGILAVSSASLMIRYAQRDAPSLVIAAYRLSLATLVLAPFTLSRQRKELAGLKKKDYGLLVISGIFLAIHFASWITSLEYTSVASSVVLVTTSPLWVALLSPSILKERISKIIWVGLLVALTGGILVGLSEACTLSLGGLSCPPLSDFLKERSFAGNLLALLGAWMACGYLLIGRRLRSTISLASYTFVVYGIAAIVLLFAVGLRGQKLGGYSPATYVLFLALALVPQLLGHSTFNWALKYLSAAYVSVALLGEPVGASILAYLLLAEQPTLLEAAGAILILTGIYLTTRSEAKSSLE
jgi:drug/metabolite transporter (DMT)-like permease